MPRAGLPRGEVSERCEDQDEGKGPRGYGPCSLCRCVLHRGRSVAVWTPLSATNRNEVQIPHGKHVFLHRVGYIFLNFKANKRIQ